MMMMVLTFLGWLGVGIDQNFVPHFPLNWNPFARYVGVMVEVGIGVVVQRGGNWTR